MRPRFLNVDLVVESRSNLQPLLTEFGERIHPLHCGPVPKPKRYLLVVESDRQHKGPDAAIHALCSLIEKLPRATQRLWSAATRREFDLGYALQTSEFSSHFSLRSNTLARLTKIGATLGVTYYHEPTKEPKEQRSC